MSRAGLKPAQGDELSTVYADGDVKKKSFMYFDFSEPKYSDMTPIYQLAKEFMKGREGK